MRIYFLVEGQVSEVELYPFWISKMIPALTKVDSLPEINDNTFYLVSGYGYPSMKDKNNILNSFNEINKNGTFNYFVICLDGDDVGVEGKIAEIEAYIAAKGLTLSEHCQLVIIVQSPCIETWLLGSRKFYPAEIKNRNFISHRDHYSVAEKDPQLMPINPSYNLPVSKYHCVYLIEMLKPGVKYSKSNPKGVMKDEYLKDLLQRLEDEPLHLDSLKNFIDFCKKVNSEINL